MYKVLIADDELLVRIGLKSMIDWEAAGFQIVGEAGNGESAYEKYLGLRPQVLITDIKMPKKDGLWLIKKVREENPEIRIVVLTCYDEFDYVREALKLQVSDYVLKAEMEEEQIEAIMKQIKEELDEEGTDELQPCPDNEGDRLIGLLLDQRKPIAEIQKEFQNLGMEWNQSRYCFLQLDFGTAVRTEKYTREQAARILSACRQVVGNRLGEKGIQCIIKQFGESLTCFLESGTLNQIRLENEVKGLQDSIFQYFNIHFKSANSRIETKVEMLHDNADWIYEIADLMFYYEEGSHIVQDLEEGRNCEILRRSDLVRWLCEAAEKKDEETIRECLDRLRASSVCRQLSSMNAKLEMIHIIDDILKQCSIYLQEQSLDTVAIQKNILESEDVIQALESMEAFFKILIGCIDNARVDNADAVIRKAVEYMVQNYADKITLEDVAGYVGISKYYFSNLFKRICKINFSSYLNEIRINEAKKMLKNPQMNVNQVAELTGYSDQQYFSKTFKKYTGMTVTEYRKQNN